MNNEWKEELRNIIDDYNNKVEKGETPDKSLNEILKEVDDKYIANDPVGYMEKKIKIYQELKNQYSNSNIESEIDKKLAEIDKKIAELEPKYDNTSKDMSIDKKLAEIDAKISELEKDEK